MTLRLKIRGVVYESADEAAAALGVGRGTIYSAAHRGTLERVGLGKGRPHGTPNVKSRVKKPKVLKNKGRMPFDFMGLKFPDYFAAAEALGYSYTGMWRAVHKYETHPQTRDLLDMRVMQYLAKRDGHKGAIPLSRDVATYGEYVFKPRSMYKNGQKSKNVGGNAERVAAE